jgi:hypothetical protein
MKKKYILIIFLVAILLSGYFFFHNNLPVILITWGHITKGKNVHIGNVSFKIPSNWSISETYDDGASLIMYPVNDARLPIVLVARVNPNQEKIMADYMRAATSKYQSEVELDTCSYNCNGIKGWGLVLKEKKHFFIIRETMVFPSKNIYFNVSSCPETYRKKYLEILNYIFPK